MDRLQKMQDDVSHHAKQTQWLSILTRICQHSAPKSCSGFGSMVTWTSIWMVSWEQWLHIWRMERSFLCMKYAKIMLLNLWKPCRACRHKDDIEYFPWHMWGTWLITLEVFQILAVHVGWIAPFVYLTRYALSRPIIAYNTLLQKMCSSCKLWLFRLMILRKGKTAQRKCLDLPTLLSAS